MEDFELYYGDVDYGSEISAKDTDFVVEKSPVARFKFIDNKIQYNQNEVSKVSCPIHSVCTAISSLSGYTFTLDERKNLWQKAISLGANPNKGWFLSSAVDLVRKYWNEKNTDKLLSFRVNRKSPEFKDLLSKGYALAVSYNGNATYNADKNADGRLDKTTFGASTYGHLVSVIDSGKDVTIVDNYKGIKHNLYLINDDHWNSLDNFGTYAYVFIFEKDYLEANDKKEIATWAQEAKRLAETKGIIKDWNNPQEIIGTEKLEWILENLGAFDKTQHKGEVSLERFAVALNRLNII